MDNINCSKPITSYQMANLSFEEVSQQFVVRQKEFERVISEIKRNDMEGSIQHYLIIGRRGSGKSTLLRRIEAEVNINQDLAERLIVINLSEEQAGIYRLYDLWDYILQHFKSLNIKIKDEPKWDDSKESSDYSRELYLTIQKTLVVNKKKLLLLLDNIDRIFDNIGDDAHFLREILTNYKDLRIIGASMRMSEHYWHYDKPFYQFFSIIKLESMDSAEVKELLLHWARCLNNADIEQFVNRNPGKIDMIRVLTDGMPRTLLNFVDLLIDRPRQNGFDYLLLILDRATPIYQERLNYFPAAQRKIIIELANFWEAVKVRQLTEACKMQGKTISAQLNQLEKDGVVEKIKGLSKDHLYRLAERFFNLWLLMTQGGPKEKRRMKYLTIFLENWYKQIELRKLASVYPDQPTENIEEAAKKYLSSTDDYISQSMEILMMLWKSELNEASVQIEKDLPQWMNYEKIDLISLIIQEFLVHKQYYLVWQLFNNEQYGSRLKEMVLPLYYVCAGFLPLKDRGEELLKPGPEIAETIEKSRLEIIERQKLYE